MNVFLRAAVLSLSVAGLVACATTDDRAMQASSQSRTIGPDQAYMSMVEKIALRRGIDVMWVNPPTTDEATLVANHD